MKKSKKGSINVMVPFAISFVVVVIVVALGGTMLGTFQTNQEVAPGGTLACGINSTGGTGGTVGSCSTAYNITGSGLTGMKTFGDFLPTIAIVLIVAVIIAIIVVYLYNMFVSQ